MNGLLDRCPYGLTVRSHRDETVLSSRNTESVSTIRDECNGVGSEISTDSKRVAMLEHGTYSQLLQ